MFTKIHERENRSLALMATLAGTGFLAIIVRAFVAITLGV